PLRVALDGPEQLVAVRDLDRAPAGSGRRLVRLVEHDRGRLVGPGRQALLRRLVTAQRDEDRLAQAAVRASVLEAHLDDGAGLEPARVARFVLGAGGGRRGRRRGELRAEGREIARPESAADAARVAP